MILSGKKHFHASWLILASALFQCCSPKPESPETIILISVDTLRPDRLSCYGHSNETSPGIDLLAKDGIVYENCIATASSTAPSLSSILTSRYPFQHGVTEFYVTKLNSSETTVSEVLSANGYRCAAFVGNPVITKDRNLSQGFSLYDDNLPQKELNRGMPERIAGPLTDAAIEWLTKTSGKRFLWLHYQDPHGPHFPPKEWRTHFPPEDTDLDRKRLPFLKDNSGYKGIPAYQKLLNINQPGYYKAIYDAEIRYMDGEISRLFDYLKQKELYKGSVVIFTADHGEAFGENDYYFCHGHLSTPDQTWVPLVVKQAGQAAAGKIVDTPVSTLDIMPSILSLARLQPPGRIAGICLPELPFYAERKKRVFFSETQWHHAVVSGNHYYTKDKPGLDKPQSNPISGGTVTPSPPRLFDVGINGLTLNNDRSGLKDEIATMNRMLDDFSKVQRAIPEGEVPKEKKRVLEALGYSK